MLLSASTLCSNYHSPISTSSTERTQTHRKMAQVELQSHNQANDAKYAQDEKIDVVDLKAQLVRELVNSEKAYVAAIKAVRTMHNQIRQQGLLNENQSRVIFADFDELEPQAEAFLKALEQRYDNWNENPRIGDVLNSFSGYLSAFNRYVSESEESVKIVHELVENNEEFAAAIANLVPTEGDAAGITLAVSLVLPLTCVTRLKAFITELKKSTDNGDQDAEALKNAQGQIDEIAKKISYSIKVSQGRKEVQKIEYGFDGHIDLVTPDRYLEARGRMTVKVFKSIRELDMFVFNDLVLFASGTGSNLTPWREEYRFALTDEQFSCEDTPDGAKFEDESADVPQAQEGYHMTMDSEFGGGFGSFGGAESGSEYDKEEDFLVNNIRLVNRDMKLTIHCDSAEEKQRWIKIFKNSKEHAQGIKGPSIANV
eukprot:TRINITY_DN78937_c0_g1_i1.p1 TRINITY_DN78937_c0_g1~~TRINITY_DN78937_c0_g1_i1.p1  ORF type:complete len:427 (+),score=138.97 TRINITY_DN78937_c0_g1_i1:161-1441(+)